MLARRALFFTAAHQRGRRGREESFRGGLGLALAAMACCSRVVLAHEKEKQDPNGLYVFGYNHFGTVPFTRSTHVSEPQRIAFFDDKVCVCEHISCHLVTQLNPRYM